MADETEYLLSSEENAERLKLSLDQAKAGNFYEMSDLERELSALLNKHGMDNATNTPDFILARHIIRDLDTYRETTAEVKRWSSDNVRTQGAMGSETP